jgi:hypothetical protein
MECQLQALYLSPSPASCVERDRKMLASRPCDIPMPTRRADAYIPDAGCGCRPTRERDRQISLNKCFVRLGICAWTATEARFATNGRVCQAGSSKIRIEGGRPVRASMEEESGWFTRCCWMRSIVVRQWFRGGRCRMRYMTRTMGLVVAVVVRSS